MMIAALGVSSAMSQDSLELSRQKDLKDVLKSWFGKKGKTEKKASIPDQQKVQFSFLPGLSYSTTTGFLIGFNLSLSKYNGNPKTTTMSSGVLSSNYTSKNQFNVKFKTDIFLENNDWYLEGDWRFSLTSQSTFGLGTSTPKENEEIVFYDQIRFYQKISRKVVGNLYLGGAVYVDRYYNIDTKNKEDVPVFPNYHNEYNRLFNYDTSQYHNFGLAAVAEFDARDNVTNPYKGVYLNAKYISNQRILGADGVSQEFDAELRSYYSFGKVNKHVFAAWLYGKFVFAGNPPYLNLPAIGWDKYERSGRGYTAGRYRGRQLFYGEFEYRFPITSNGLFGGVAFVNVTSASNEQVNESLFEYMKPAYGLGLRLKFDKFSRTNIAVDFGKASDGSTSFVLNLGEVF